jgi:hypothetical protein
MTAPTEIYQGIVTTRVMNLPEFMEDFFINLPIDQFNTSFKLNRDWYKECERELIKRRNKYIKKYWETVKEYNEANKAFNEYWLNDIFLKSQVDSQVISQVNQYHDKSSELCDKKFKDFEAWVEVDKAILRCGFTNIDTKESLNFYIDTFIWGMDPCDKGEYNEWVKNGTRYGDEPDDGDSYFCRDYWGDEDPDV